MEIRRVTARGAVITFGLGELVTLEKTIVAVRQELDDDAEFATRMGFEPGEVMRVAQQISSLVTTLRRRAPAGSDGNGTAGE